jgi:hypothetical protein
MPTNTLYHTWFQRIQELRPKQRITQVRTFVWLMIGVYQSRSVCLSRVAGKIPGPAKLLSTTRRLSRLLNNCQAELKVSTNQELKKSTFQEVNLSTHLLSEFFNIRSDL